MIVSGELLPYTTYQQGENPFVIKAGVPAPADLMNFRGAMSSVDAGPHSTPG
jgi:hypothetical protein